VTTTTTSDPSYGATVERPTTVAEAAELLRRTAGSVVVRGGGTKSTWGGRVTGVDLELQTGGLDRLLSHNPADMTAHVEAGMGLRRLQEILAGAGQWLALDPPTEAAGATIGGLLAAGDSGPRRLRYGAMRDLVIGVTLVLADGTVAKAGGHVIKNVAGYDLTKLMYGSLGSLALIAEVVVRVHPVPETSATVVTPASASEATTSTLQLMASPLEPSAIQWTCDLATDSSNGRLAVHFEGSTAGVAAQITAARDLLLAGGLSAEQVAEADTADLWSEQTGTHPATGCSVAGAGTLPGDLAYVADALARAAHENGVTGTLVSQGALGLHTAHLHGAPEAQARVLDGWRRAVLARGGSVLLKDRPPDVDKQIDALGPPPSAVTLLRAVKVRLDPDGRWAPGRFGSWY
jgi:glycolate oxidase FAD binding subunit